MYVSLVLYCSLFRRFATTAEKMQDVRFCSTAGTQITDSFSCAICRVYAWRKIGVIYQIFQRFNTLSVHGVVS
jgi:hypothetical protein